MHVTNKIIINADDFGYSDAVNGAILKCFQKWLVTSTSLLVNMPGFQGAVEMAHAHPIFSGKIGVRLNLTEGFSLTSGIRDCTSFCHVSGFFILKESSRLLVLNKREKQAVYEEMRTQLETALLAGIHPSHLDIHHSLHRQWPIATALASLAREYGIPRVRFSRSMGPEMRGVRGHYRRLFNRLVARLPGICGPDLSGCVCDWLKLPEKRRPAGKYIEIAVHPILDEYGDLIDKDGKDLQRKLRPVIDHRHTISYTDLPVRTEKRDRSLGDTIRDWSLPALPGEGLPSNGAQSEEVFGG
ncbi:MAG TPA: ChbG/HpnK family deacetylase [Puia sp.]|nr:ChbG/HpnK family deacetylase [Puia sp.]